MDTHDSHVYKSGYCELGDGHHAYVECFGNKHARPMLFLHGGPGSGFSDSHKKLFDPERDNVIFYDQRGAGKSIPSCAVSLNTTDNLVEDIPRILAYVGVEVVYIIGVSWGVALGLLFAIRYPKRVSGFLLASVFLATKKESRHFVDGSIASIYPDAWARFIAPVPSFARDDMATWYWQHMTNGIEKEKEMLAKIWTAYDLSISSGVMDQEKIERVLATMSYRSLAVLTAHYVVHDFFLPDGYIESNISQVPAVPVTIIHGKEDVVTDSAVALKLHSLIPESDLVLIEAGHGSSAMFNTIREHIAKISA